MIDARAFYEAAERLFSIIEAPSDPDVDVSGKAFREALLGMIPNEVLLRIIVGRAYFAVFLIARLKAWSEGVGLEKIGTTGRSHRQVREYHEREKGDAGKDISHSLIQLSRNRNKADYDIDKDVSVEAARESLDLCKDALDELSNLS